ncbi:hypothetical protein A3F58_04400 [Candidatus Roizmanbacteria bacterium RIFCSPHIGHO2_12_FULL_37_9b]|uniref:Alpha/beta hydrolase n=1 Tax=Candidatus Roizmanbacteria bacterium RIFCSPHIGHO2_02_FULL_38_11 TaxID=1802039 RepID=A0A1F7H116_9BACT|nr:MAG: hypothetical protein A3C25_06145 [Candidatus Roizmanbacteria bacterium RIFCSPHIGHO2_02_FULL_38_11]OGK33383.1 MAG: hypothetical protein A3F58_04400 [Candidatus Roizmanbacteria bacterium RIFCSPHIGHO2_12_FULL_37_9b]
MNKKALILHAWYNKHEDHWYPWLNKELQNKGFETYLPEIPTFNTNLPSLTASLKFTDNLKIIDNKTIVIGHSLGCLLAMRLAEKYPYQKMFLVAGWDFDDLTYEHRLFWKTKINHKKIKKNVKEIYCISSDNDPYTTAFTVEEMNKRLGGKFILIKGAGHFTEKDGVKKIPDLLQYI